MTLKITFQVTPYDSALYKKAVHLREEVLRKPLGLFFVPEELEMEREHFHIVGLQEGEVIATVMLVPEGQTCKMRQVAVREDLRNMGIGSQIITFCEESAQEKGFTSLYCHARHTAISFYLKSGYEIEGDYFEENTVPHVKMRKILRA